MFFVSSVVRVGSQTVSTLGLARTTYTVFMYCIFGREITRYTVYLNDIFGRKTTKYTVYIYGSGQPYETP